MQRHDQRIEWNFSWENFEPAMLVHHQTSSGEICTFPNDPECDDVMINRYKSANKGSPVSL
jgi:hypothetical protein